MMHQPILSHNDVCPIQTPHDAKDCDLLGREIEDIDFESLPPWMRILFYAIGGGVFFILAAAFAILLMSL